MLIFNLKKEWYDKIRSGEKTVEYREAKRYWIRRLQNAEFSSYTAKFYLGIPVFEKYEGICELRKGYARTPYLVADITKVELVDGWNTDLHLDKPVYAIHLKNVKEKNADDEFYGY